MIKLFENLMKKQKEKNDAQLLAEEDFDKLMKELEGDETSLAHLERHMRDEWEEVHKDMDDVTREVDKIVMEKE